MHQYAIDAWKATLRERPQAMRAAWKRHDAALHSFLRNSIPEALQHTGEAAFDEHLLGVQNVLRVFGADDDVCTAGLFHSIYGTEGFQGYKLPLHRRPELRKLLGARPERLVWLFCVMDRHVFDMAVFAGIRPVELRARAELGNFSLPIASDAEWHDLMELVLADWMDQVEGAAGRANELFEWTLGEAWSYRRLAYHAMSHQLGTSRGPRGASIEAVVESIYAKEPLGTRHLVQEVTPPMSQAARDARDALASCDW
ncbi:hypothetical protein ACHHYP_06051 [Achlya hypogyna]|uniref:DUF6817 domain-containing protein n=1 Tax=Achlya hypogyna TaxID=1202772 RepID=A0A1V9YVQ1_ACHHY|nr:hypothetical protein ACHHYP_06051 [Achlya hypogyna]